MPTRIQCRRSKGWRAPEGAVYVGCGTRWGNPCRTTHNITRQSWYVYDPHSHTWGSGIADAAEARREATEGYRKWMFLHPELAAAAGRRLADRDLMCWCPLPEPGEPDYCHAAVLLELAAGADGRAA